MTRQLQGRLGGAITFLLIAGLVIGGLGWVTWSALRVERAQQDAAAEARLVNQVRLALWRLDSGMIAPLGVEDSRPYDHYSATCSPLNGWAANNEVAVSFRVPSPLISCPIPDWMSLHFQVDPRRGFASPQVPTTADFQDLNTHWADVPTTNVTEERTKTLANLQEQFDLSATLATLAARESSLARDTNSLAFENSFFQTPQSLTATVQTPASAPLPPAACIASTNRFWGCEWPPFCTAQPIAQGLAVPQIGIPPQVRSVTPPLQLDGSAQLGLNLANGTNPSQNFRYNVKNVQELEDNNEYSTRAQIFSRGMSEQKQAFIKNTATTGNGFQIPNMAGNATSPVPVVPAKPLTPTENGTPTGGGPGAQVPQQGLEPHGLSSRPRENSAGAQAEASRTRQQNVELPRDLVANAAPNFVHLGAMRPQWLRAKDGVEHLALVRAARLDQRVVYQGILIDWDKLQATLKEQVKDLFPEAKLHALHDDAGVTPERAMTALPVQLDPGPTPEPVRERWTPLRFGLALAWAAALLALAAVGLGGWTLIDLSERRIRFVSAVTHELRTPLTSLRLYLDLLTSGMITEEAKKEEYLKTLHCESDRLHRLIDNVLNYARLENRSIRAEKAPLRVNGLLEQIRETWHDRCGNDGRELQVVSTLDAEQTLLSDTNLLQQILGNLIDNARKYSKDADDNRIWLWARPAGKAVVFEVEDRGPGIPLGERTSIFRPFRRGDSADTTAGGAGLGLALARQWATALGGTLTYRPADGGTGACFRLEIPQ